MLRNNLMIYYKELTNIEKEFNEFYEREDIYDDEEYNDEEINHSYTESTYYKGKLNIFNKLKKLIEKIRKIDKKCNVELIREILILWAENTGTAEDQIIADNLLFQLFEEKFISKNEYDFFESNKATNRWF